MSIQNLTITGNVTRDPELSYSPNGTALARFGVATNDRKRTAEGKWEDGEASYWNITAFRDLAEHVVESVKKGSRVTVQGKLAQRKYTNKEGEERVSYDFVANDVSISLLFATAEVTRIQRSGGNGNSSESTEAMAAAYLDE